MSGVIDSLLPVIDSVLSVRDQIGAVIKPAYFLTRTWSGERVGDGTAADTVAQILPSPALQEYTQTRTYSASKAGDGGYTDAQDLLVKSISKNSYPSESQIRCISDDPRIEKFYLIGSDVYTVISVNSRYLTWDVQLRKISNQTRY